MTLVPSTRLLAATFGVALIACLAGPLRELMPVWLIGAGAVIVLALADALLALLRAKQASASAPPVLRFTKDRPSVLPITFKNPSEHGRRVRFGLALPPSFEMALAESSVDLPAGAGHA